MKPKTIITRVCEQCGIIYYPKRKDDNIRFCSRKCIGIHYKKNAELSKDKHCIQCGNIFHAMNKSTKFCGHSCSATYTNARNGDRSEETKNRISSSLKEHYKDIPKVQKKCILCGSLYNSKDSCTLYPRCLGSGLRQATYRTLAKAFGFSLGKLSTYENIEHAIEIFKEAYFDYGMSSVEIHEGFELPGTAENTVHLLKSLGINLRSRSDAMKFAVAFGKFDDVRPEKVFIDGDHIGWNGRTHYYRSSYELDMMKHFDDLEMDYLTEPAKILYWDSQKEKERIAIPDFIVSDILLYEIKSYWTYDRTNMEDKFRAYREVGYEPALVLEGILYEDELPEGKEVTIYNW